MERAFWISFAPENFDFWREVHDRTKALRLEYGIREGPLFRGVSDPDQFVFRLDVEDLAQAMECFKLDAMQETTRQTPVHDAEFWIAHKRKGRADFVSQHEADIRESERAARELELARLVQTNLLPEKLPELGGWEVAAHYEPASSIGGDFYDFIDLPDGQVGIVVGDVTDKGIPAAMVMAATRSVLRAAAQRLVNPGEVLERVNELLRPDIPPMMFVTCLYAVLDPSNGRLRYANAGHPVPYVLTGESVGECRATGMPLGLMPGMAYEEKQAFLAPGAAILLYSDGLTEAHSADGEMYGSARIAEVMGDHRHGSSLVERVLSDLRSFTGSAWEQEDDITVVYLERSAVSTRSSSHRGRVLAEFTVPSAPGNERLAIKRVGEAVIPLGLSAPRLERLKTAVGEATMNAIEHGNEFRPELAVDIEVRATSTDLAVRITDQGGKQTITDSETPDLDAKLAGRQTPRGWGLFLIERMIDDVRVESDGRQHTVELVVHLSGPAGD